MPNYGLAIRSAGEVVTSGAGTRLAKGAAGATQRIDALVPGMGRVFQTAAPLRSQGFVNLIKTSPGKAVATLATAITGGIIGEWALDELREDPDQKVREFAERAARELAELFAAVGVGDPTPNEDGKVGSEKVEEFRNNVAIADAAHSIYKSAVAAVGGEQRLRDLMMWFAIDDDLKQVILDRGLSR